MRFSTLLLWVNATIIGASPLESRANHGQKDNLNDIEREFTGIYWKEAYDTCTDDEFDTLVKATKMSSLIMQYQTPYSGSSTTDGAISAVYDSAAWNRYFLAPEAAQSNDLKYSWAVC
jgi:hypothetical protein